MKVMLINTFGIVLIILVNLMFIYGLYLRICEYMNQMKNEANNKSLKKKLHDPDELNDIYENLGGM